LATISLDPSEGTLLAKQAGALSADAVDAAASEFGRSTLRPYIRVASIRFA
jgi:hypothetical protein